MSSGAHRDDLYRILHVRRDAPPAVVKSSYRALMLDLDRHPDRGGDHAEAAAINEAYRILSDPDARAAYDRMLDERHRSDRAPAQDPRDGHSVPDRSCPFCHAPPATGIATVSTCPSCSSPLTSASTPTLVDPGRRSTQRVARDDRLRIWVEWPQPSPHTGRLVDLSAGGLRLSTRVDLAVGTVVKISGTSLDAVGRVASVRRRRHGSDVGVEFLTLRLDDTRGTFVSTTG